MTENELVEWHHWLRGHEFEQALGDGEEQRSLACCSPWGHKESEMTEQLNNNNVKLASLVAQTGNNLPASAGELASILGSERSPGEGNGNPLQYCYLENSMDRGAWQATVHAVTKSGAIVRALFICMKSESESCSVVSHSLWSHELYSPWNSPGQNTGVGSLSLLRGGSSQRRHWTQVSLIAGRFFTSWATREAQEYSSG